MAGDPAGGPVREEDAVAVVAVGQDETAAGEIAGFEDGDGVAGGGAEAPPGVGRGGRGEGGKEALGAGAEVTELGPVEGGIKAGLFLGGTGDDGAAYSLEDIGWTVVENFVEGAGREMRPGMQVAFDGVDRRKIRR